MPTQDSTSARLRRGRGAVDTAYQGPTVPSSSTLRAQAPTFEPRSFYQAPPPPSSLEAIGLLQAGLTPVGRLMGTTSSLVYQQAKGEHHDDLFRQYMACNMMRARGLRIQISTSNQPPSTLEGHSGYLATRTPQPPPIAQSPPESQSPQAEDRATELEDPFPRQLARISQITRFVHAAGNEINRNMEMLDLVTDAFSEIVEENRTSPTTPPANINPTSRPGVAGFDCAVCRQDEGDTQVSDLPCGHHFCFDCIKTWVDWGNDTCPLCQERIV